MPRRIKRRYRRPRKIRGRGKTVRRIKKALGRSKLNRAIKLWTLRNMETNEQRRDSQFNVGPLLGDNWNFGFQCFPISPNVASNNGIQIQWGDGPAQRKGNVIRTTRSRIRFTAHPFEYDEITNPTPQPVYFCYFVLSAKAGVDLENLTDVISVPNDMFQNGNITAAAARNTFDMIRPINTDKYTVHMFRKVKLGFEFFQHNTQTLPAVQFNNDFKIAHFKKLNLTKYCPKRIKYNDNDPQPTCAQKWLCFYVCNADGSTMPVNRSAVRVNLTQEYMFKDV